MTRPLLPALAAVLALAGCGSAVAGDADDLASGARAATSGLIGFSDLIRDPGVPFLGSENADVVIVGYVDYNCGYCKKMQPVVDAVMKADPKVRVLYKDWPIFGAVSQNAARTALAAGYQGKYEAVHNGFMQSPGRITSDADIQRLAQQAGVDMTRLERDLSEHRTAIDAVLSRNGREARALALQGTPAFVINGRLIPGGMPKAYLEAVIARVRTDQPLGGGTPP